MIREKAVDRNLGSEDNFRWRGGEVSRIEGLSDAVFAFAITLLVVSLEVPNSFARLLSAMQDFLAFGVCFTMLMLVWYWHYRFFRRFGLHDTFTVVLNAVLLFVVLLYVYPLKFLFRLVFLQVLEPGSQTLAEMFDPAKEGEQVTQLMLIYGVGFMAVHLLFAALYLYAYTRRNHLELNAAETGLTRRSAWSFVSIAMVGLASILIVAVGGVAYAAPAGYVYMAIAPVRYVQGTLEGRQRRSQEQAALQAGNK